MVYITRREHFSAAHRLFLPEFSDEENDRVFGKCSNPNWHGHNYILFVTIKGPVDPKTGLIIHLRQVSKLIEEKILRRIDHRNLNLEVDFLKGKVPTSENVAIGIWNELEQDVRNLGGILHCIRLEQSENNIVEYFGT
ncbi:MAG: 6-carboxytetrahydropterin synthase [Alphaproteobacteria bacterium]|nr:6-carboxytetrahydropterin synthase [Alphaproteobacteria bacterium]